MKYIHYIRESIDDNIKLDIKDIAIELVDYGFDYETKDCKYYKDGEHDYECFAIEIKDSKERFFRLEDLSEVLLRIRDYVKNTNYSIDIGIPKDDTYLSLEDFIEEFEGEELYEMEIYIYDNRRHTMKHLKTYESFEMNKSECDRCGGPTKGITTMSIFNQDIICMTCKAEEKKDPEYKAAQKAEVEAIKNGDTNYKGAIPDYKPLI